MRPLVLASLRFYRLAISPSLGQHCRYYPSCSAYAVQAVGEHGVLRGARLAFVRLLRCNPWSRGGIDMVPSRAATSDGM
jgi:uncharacterized protein